MSAPPRSWWLAVLVAVMAVVVAGPSAAQSDAPPPDPAGGPPADVPADKPATPKLSDTLTGVAKAEYEAAKLLYADGDFANAIVKFKKVHELSGDPRLLWNIAVCEKNLRRYSKMLRSIERYLAETEGKLTPEERARADQIVATVQGFISELKLEVDQNQAKVFVDEEEVATTPVGNKLFLDVGKRKIRIEKDGYAKVVRELEVPGGGVVELKILMEKELHRGTLEVVAREGDLISLDGKAVGRGRWKGSVTSGGHTLRVTAPGMQPLQQEVTIKDGQKRTVEVALSEQPEDSTATILWIVGGVTLAAGAAVAAGFLFAPAENPPVQGSMNPGVVQLTVGTF